MKKTNNKGFSLIELIIVIAIMAVLVAIIAPNLTKYLGKSKKNTDKKNKDEIESTLKTCLTDYDMEHDALITDGASDTVTVRWAKKNDGSGKVESTVTGATGASANTDFKAIVDSAVDAAKTQSKENTSKYALATITKNNSSNAYEIEVDFS
jgi:type IV pilus assembly protein PilA